MSDLDLSCGHCGHRGPVEKRESVLVGEDTEEAAGFGTIHWKHYVTVYRCGACEEVTLSEAYWGEEIGESFAEKILFPSARDNSAVPERVRSRYTAALRVRKIEPGLYAVGIRRMLEALCKVEGADGGTLFEKLDDLAAKDRIPALLAEIAHELRGMGNLGAHDEEVEVASEDVPLIEDLADAILEYLHRAPAKLAAVKEGMARRKEGSG